MSISTIASSSTHNICVIIKISGVGVYLDNSDLSTLDSDGRVRFCTDVPSYGQGFPGVFKPFIAIDGLPRQLSVSVDQFGGVPRVGGMSFSLIDHDDWLTSNLRVEGAADGLCDEALTESETALDVVSGDVSSNFSTDRVIWVGNEAIRVTARSGDTLTIDRAYAGTNAENHNEGDLIYRYIPFLRGRSVELCLAPLEGGSASDEVTVGTYFIDEIAWDPATTQWSFGCSSQLRTLGRLAPGDNQFQAEIEKYKVYNNRKIALAYNPIKKAVYWSGGNWSSGDDFVKIGEEVWRYERTRNWSKVIVLTERGLCGTKSGDGLKKGKKITRVCAAHPTSGSFRYSPGPSPASFPSSGTWVNSTHWVDILLCILTSSGRFGLTSTSNFTSSAGNWSSLPPGFGIGVDADRIDFDSFLEIRDRSASFDFSGFYFGDEQISFGELINEKILKVVGAYMVDDHLSGKIVLRMPRVPYPGQSTRTINEDNILTDGDEPNWKISYPIDTMQGQTVFALGHEGHTIEVRDTSSASSAKAIYEETGNIRNIDAGYVLPGKSSWLQSRGMSYAWRSSRSQMHIDVAVDLSFYDVIPGEIVSIDLPHVPNLQTGGRGITGLLCEVLSSTLVMDCQEDGSGRGFYIELSLQCYTHDTKTAAIAPSAQVSSVSSNTATVIANRFTASGGLGASNIGSDAEGFSVGDVCIVAPIGTGIPSNSGSAPYTQEITSISGNDITFDGNFSGNLTADKVIRLAPYNLVLESRKSTNAWTANESEGTIGPGQADRSYIWGEL